MQLSNVGPGTYVVAVSGGVDSVVLLDLLTKQNDAKLIVAHFDHGIRTDSIIDRQLVQQLAKKHGLPFVHHEGHLGASTSEAVARAERYKFLRQVQAATKANAIMTAHHQDDVIETAIINMMRGTNRKGITSLKDHRHLRRPMLHIPKKDIISYAKDQGLVWRDDSTNEDTTLLRNYVRRVLVPKLGAQGRQDLLNHIGHLSVINRAIDNDLMLYLHIQPSRQTLDRHAFVLLPHDVSIEVMAQWLRSHDVASFDRKMLEMLVMKSKTLEPGKQVDIDVRHRLVMGHDGIVLIHLG